MDDESLLVALRNSSVMARREEQCQRRDGHRFTADVLHDCALLMDEAAAALEVELGTIVFDGTTMNSGSIE